MNKDFTAAMSKKTDDELIKIITVDVEKYETLAIDAAKLEIEKRNISLSNIKSKEEEYIAKINTTNTLDRNSATRISRFINFIVDLIVVFFIYGILSTILALFINRNTRFFDYLNLLLLLASYYGYYYFYESKTQQTLAKQFTKTKVVTENGEQPCKNDIMKRTFCRFIPFDRISYLFTPRGLHDRFSNTRVIKC